MNTGKDFMLDAFSEMGTHLYVMDYAAVRQQLRSLAASDTGSMRAGTYIRERYSCSQPELLWVGAGGVRADADTLVSYLHAAAEAGVNIDLLRVPQIESDMMRLREFNFDETDNINTVIARTDYNLTRAFVRYSAFQHYGFVNPTELLNKLDVKDSTKREIIYHQLYDIPTQRPDRNFASQAVDEIRCGRAAAFLKNSQPDNPLYLKLVDYLKTASTKQQREKIICNIERCRWRQDDYPERHDKRVVINIPSFMLYAANADSTMSMRIVCGARKTKTPLLNSRLERMDVNPRWIVPTSISKGIVYDTAYLRRERMFIQDKQLGRVDYSQASIDKVMRHEQYVIQESGDGNSLGRIIFRFRNNFAVYLHYTSSPHLFSRKVRAFSHGCIRVEKPMTLVAFILGGDSGEIYDRIDYSIKADLSDNQDDNRKDKEPLDKDRLIWTAGIEPALPLFITYYTCYADETGKPAEYDDIYGYDKVILENLRPYIK